MGPQFITRQVIFYLQCKFQDKQVFISLVYKNLIKNSSTNVLEVVTDKFHRHCISVSKGLLIWKYLTGFATFQHLIVSPTFNAFWVVRVNRIP